MTYDLTSESEFNEFEECLQDAVVNPTLYIEVFFVDGNIKTFFSYGELLYNFYLINASPYNIIKKIHVEMLPF